ncbi:MAG: hypothetical protein ACOVO2_20315 [Emticicia sp.]|uniref:hypothetical protein n=1 Tax=Emticicia sp. TaxID=1930953 RepID=UPI003BA6CB26
MLKYILFLIILTPFFSFSQQGSFKPCSSVLLEKWKFQYYSYNTKYPLSSEKLTEQLNRTLTNQPRQINGFVTIRFVVNCEGQTGNFEIYQIDNHYQNTKFDEKYVEELLTFTKTLNDWKIAIHNKTLKVDYYTYLTFKIEHGKVTEIVP